jgi:hypothetical protein
MTKAFDVGLYEETWNPIIPGSALVSKQELHYLVAL